MTRERRLVWIGVALVTFGLASAQVFGPVVRAGFETAILTETGTVPPSLALFFGEPPYSEDELERWRGMLEADHRFTVWATARNAFALLHDPLHVFDAEPCHPAAHALAFGHPLLAFGLLGLPAQLLSGDPVATYNLVALLLPWLAALAMYLLVVEWTDVPAAGLTAGLLYGFHASKLANVFHPFAEDTGWTVLGMLFLLRTFEHGRTRDALGAACAYALQVASSLYAIVTSICVSAPFLLWLVWRYRARAIRARSVLLAGAVFLGLAALLLWPYASFLAPAEAPERIRLYGSWSDVFPLDAGYVLIALLGLASLLPKALESARARAARWPLLAIAFFCALVATGGNVNARKLAEAAGRDVPFAWPNAHEWLSALLPGIETVRVVGFTDAGTHLAACALAGLGAAAAYRRARGRWRGPVAVALVAGAWLGALGVPGVGPGGAVAYGTFDVRPPEATLRFYRALEERGNAGPILELPVPKGFSRLDQNARRQLVSAYHQRRTSSCYNSYVPPEVHDVEALAETLPSPEALHALQAMGFTTIVVHHPPEQLGATRTLQALAALSHGPGALLRRVHDGASMTAFEIVDAAR